MRLLLARGREVSLQQRLISAGILTLVLALSVYLFLYNPDGSNIYPKCPFHTLTGIYCPGCGSLRALHQILHGNILAAFGMNALMVLFIPLLSWVVVSQCCVAVRGRPLPALFVPAWWIWILLAIIIVFWVLRNVPFYPFTLLAP